MDQTLSLNHQYDYSKTYIFGTAFNKRLISAVIIAIAVGITLFSKELAVGFLMIAKIIHFMFILTGDMA